ncbi:efflux RND transporter periplasmic adaptor subunit [archaeon]|nr:efflux RND transporter periplasmic adaptor subunit [archaeon]
MTEVREEPIENEDSLFQRRRKKRKARKRIWIGVAAVLVLGAGAFAYYQWGYLPKQVPTETADAEMQTSVVRQGDLLIYASGTGNLVSGDEVTAAFSVTATINSVNVAVGDTVTAGDVLMTVDNTDLEAAYQDALRSFNEMSSAAAIAQAKQSISSYEGDVSSDISLLTYFISDTVYYAEVKIAQREAELVEAQATGDADAIAEAERLLRNANALLAEGQSAYGEYLWENFTKEECEGEGRDQECEDVLYAPSTIQIAEARNTLDLDQALLKEAEDYLTLVTTGEVPVGATGSGITSYLNAQEALQTAEENLDKTTLVAPISGLVTSVNGGVGDSSSSAKVVIQDVSTMYLEVYLDGADWVNIAVGYEADITFDALPDDTYTGTVVQVDPFLTTDLGGSLIGATVEISAESMEKLGRIPLGSSAAVEIISGRAENALLVPVESLREISDGQYGVFVVENGEPKLRVVEVGIVDTYYAEVTSGLEVGDVVTTGIAETD